MKQVILSGIQPSGKLHLGNLFGAVLNWVKLQDDYQCHYMIADWHALTNGSVEDFKAVENCRKELILNLLTFGIDPVKSVLFIQSQVKEHADLHLVLSMLTPVPWLERNPTYKDQLLAQNIAAMNNYGFLGYPVLQAADIMIYKADRVPVGEDQLPHLELTREIVRKFNKLFGETFPEPQGVLTKCSRIPGTDGKKMSKSLNNAIYTDDETDVISKKVRMLITDPQKIRLGDKGHPDICDCFALHLAFGSEEQTSAIRVDCESGKLGCVDCKKNLAGRINTFLDPYREKKRKLIANSGFVNDVIADGNRRARETASRTLSEVYDKTGLSFHGF